MAANQPACPRCARPQALGEVCAACRRGKPAFDASHAALRYDYPLNKLLAAAKYQAQFDVCAYLGRRLAKSLTKADVDVIVSIPLHPQRLAERGYNHAFEIAKALSQTTQLPLHAELLSRSRHTAQQITLQGKLRRKNMRDAFLASVQVQGLRVALVDDVMTTGATLHEAAQALKWAGARSVQCWVVARAQPHTRQ
jgi:ComF family protein